MCYFITVPGQNTSTTWRGWTCRWWCRAMAGQSSPGLWICGRRRLEGCRRLSLACGPKGWRWGTPPWERSSLRPRRSLTRDRQQGQTNRDIKRWWREHSSWTYWSPWGWESLPAWLQSERRQCRWLQPDHLEETHASQWHTEQAHYIYFHVFKMARGSEGQPVTV